MRLLVWLEEAFDLASTLEKAQRNSDAYSTLSLSSFIPAAATYDSSQVSAG